MKISNSKRQLAKIISENGGWPNAAEFAVQGRETMLVGFSKKMPYRRGCGWFIKGETPVATFKAERVITNWHQIILSRDEYFHLHPAPDADGWIVWKSQFYGDMPVPEGTEVDIMVDGTVYHRYVAEVWKHWGTTTKYRLYKSPAAQPEPVAVEPTPTIEQLAADYKAKRAIAQQAQEEADSHRCGAEVALEKLVAAGKALGLVLSVSAPEPELVITDWRDLLPGDEVEYVNGGQPEDFGRIGVVDCTEFDESSPDMNVRLMFSGGHSGWPVEWRFIRRP